MTGTIYKKNKRTSSGRVDQERVVMNEGDASSTATESEHGSDRVIAPIRPPIARNLKKALERAMLSNKFDVLVVSLVFFNWLIVVVELLINLRIFELGQQVGVKHPISSALHIINVTILGVFVLEMWIKLIVFGCRFFKHRMNVFDLVVVVFAFSLILAFGGRENSADSAGLLVVARLWRVSRIVNSMIEQVKHDAERKMAKERRSLRALQREVCKLRDYCLQQDCELRTYRAILHHNCIPLPTVIRPPPAPRTLNVIAEVNEVEQLPLKRPPPVFASGCQEEQPTNSASDYKGGPPLDQPPSPNSNVNSDCDVDESPEEVAVLSTVVDEDQPPQYSDEMAAAGRGIGCGPASTDAVASADVNAVLARCRSRTPPSAAVAAVHRLSNGDECSAV